MLSSEWLIHQDSAISYLPLLIAFVKGQDILLKPSEEKIPLVMSYSPDQPGGIVGKWELTDPMIPENSLAVLPLMGPITSYDSIKFIGYLRQAEANDRIIAIAIPVNSPGGMVSQTDVLANTIKTLSKPTVAIVQGMAASAAMWIISAMDYRVATSKMDVIGSIGTKTSIRDFTPLLEKIGIKTTDFYATKSTNKDGISRAATSGNIQPITEHIDFINEVFHQAIMANLKLAADSPIFTGDTYFAEKAIEHGLINEINTMEYALQKAYSLGLINKIKIQSKSLNF